MKYDREICTRALLHYTIYQMSFINLFWLGLKLQGMPILLWSWEWGIVQGLGAKRQGLDRGFRIHYRS